MKWSKDQENAIKARDCNLLVSAAAGSGKTAVLIERILKQVTDKDNPIDIDSILVVTFTNAAAGEMRARLARAFEQALKDNPGDKHLIRQIGLVENAQISTIDSFCIKILKNYYNSINLEPDFRMADEGELNLIKEDVLEALFEEKFEEGDPKFLEFVDSFSPGKGFDALSSLVFDLHRFSQSKPWPMEWLRECEAVFNVTSPEEYEKLPLVKSITEYIRNSFLSNCDDYDYIIECCNEPSGPEEYISLLESERDQFMELSRIENLSGFCKALPMSFDSLPRSGKSDKDIKEEIQKVRNGVKARVKEIYEKFCKDLSIQVKELALCRPMAEVYLDLTREFIERFQQYKKDKNIMDFSDGEHYALDILVNRQDGKCVYTEIADELAKQFNQIYIDEYQDSNLVQEYILTAVSGERFGEPNIFMVGDVKQSIYKFRMAKPELFMEKHDTYATFTEDSNEKYQKVELHENYRSRENVLESINDVFYRIMQKNIGGIDYTHDVRLNFGGSFTEEVDDKTELLLIMDDTYEDCKVPREELQANVIAGRIKEMMAENPKLTYRDFAVLLRSDKSFGPVYSNILSNHGIPSVYASTRGYFAAKEIVTVMNLLTVIDNPRQEIPLAGTMRSYFAYFDAEEMAIIKGSKRRTELYDCLLQYADKEDELALKCRKLLDFINSYRKKATVYSIRELISSIVYGTGYYDYVGAKPGGRIKKANLDMLLEKAGEFEKTSYFGLFNFLRYIEKLQKYDVDYGEGKTGSDDENLVKIMSIHKSKGLEFPVVFIGDMSKGYNLSDGKKSIIYDSNVGIGMNYVNLKERYKEKTTYKNMVEHQIKAESVGEELRVLYVAMTRAVDKLIMVGNATAKKTQEWGSMSQRKIDTNYILENTNFSSLVVPCAMGNSRYAIDYLTAKDIAGYMMEPDLGFAEDLCEGMTALNEATLDEDCYNRVKEILEYRYPFENIISVKSKYSVSDLKHAAMEESELLEARIDTPDKKKRVPEFISKEEEVVGGINRGNAYHKVFELLDYNKVSDRNSVKVFLTELVENGKITQDMVDLINPVKFENFLGTTLGLSMKKAFNSNKLYREQPYIMEVGANKVNEEYPSDEKVLVQGIIDAFYIEDDKVHIVDYKTDRVSHEDVLVARYAKQLELYRDAITAITGKEVAACHIYSVALDKDICIY